MRRPNQRTLERQTATVARLAAELRFELLLLRRMRVRDGADAPSAGAAEPTLAEIHAAAVLRDVEADFTP